MKSLPLSLLIAALSILPLSGQHDPGRGAVRKLARGQADAALKEVESSPAQRNSKIDEAEIQFVKMMVACHLNEPEKALELAKQAVENGLPITRLQAGPREKLKVLHDYEPYRKWVAERSSPLVHGPMLGSVTDHSASFWVRTAKEAEVSVRLKTDPPAPARAAKVIAARTSADQDFTAVIQVQGLSHGMDYEYELLIDGEVVGGTHEFRTPPAQGARSKFTVAFGGGAGYTPKHEHMWATIGKRQPDALLLLGDNVYIDDPEHQLTNDYCYYRRHSVPEWRSLVAKTPVYAIYDDHDFGMNDCVPGSRIDQPAWKRSVWETFRNNWVNPAYAGGDKQPGCWFDFMVGDVHFIMLDCRYYRHKPGKGGSMLGEVQKAWLMDALRNSKGVFKVIVSSVPFSPGVKKGSRDTWDGFPQEREEIFAAIEKHRIPGVVLMAADRHRSDYRKIPRAKGYDLYEAMSSRLTNVHTHGMAKNAKGSEFLMGYNGKCSFGLIEFDTTAKDPTLSYTIVDIDNQEQGKATLKLSELGFE
ncbi:MAG: alkaline phosphatase D family protein [Akkermansiaceae bacterium]|nr:alkaline phosphatase D family protein [Akkermansiaceae bacterium]